MNSDIFLRKFRTLFLIGFAVAVYPFVFCLVSFFNLLRPILLIRFVRLESGRIGHFSADTELYLCQRDAGIFDRRTYDIFYHAQQICNRQLKRMWDRTLRVSYIATLVIDRLRRYLPGYQKHIIFIGGFDRDIHGLIGRSDAHLSFTEEEERLGRAAFRKFGIAEGAPIVCIHARDSLYMNTVEPNRDWRYGDFRNSKIDDFLPAAEALTRMGYYVVRMGAIVRDQLVGGNPGIIDYAMRYRTDFMDIYLCAKCAFFLGSSSGVSSVSLVFRRHIAFTNFIPLEYVPAWSRDYLFIPKKLWSREKKRLMSFREILNSGAGRFMDTKIYEKAGIDIIDNAAEEITDLALEMDGRTKGTWRASDEDEELQKRFWSLFRPSELNSVFLSRIGAEFLRQNKKLLD